MPVICSKCGHKQRGGKYCQECGGEVEEIERPAKITGRVIVYPATNAGWALEEIHSRDFDGHLESDEWESVWDTVRGLRVEVSVDTATHEARLVGIAKEEADAQSSCDG